MGDLEEDEERTEVQQGPATRIHLREVSVLERCVSWRKMKYDRDQLHVFILERCLS